MHVSNSSPSLVQFAMQHFEIAPCSPKSTFFLPTFLLSAPPLSSLLPLSYVLPALAAIHPSPLPSCPLPLPAPSFLRPTPSCLFLPASPISSLLPPALCPLPPACSFSSSSSSSSSSSVVLINIYISISIYISAHSL